MKVVFLCKVFIDEVEKKPGNICVHILPIWCIEPYNVPFSLPATFDSVLSGE